MSDQSPFPGQPPHGDVPPIPPPPWQVPPGAPAGQAAPGAPVPPVPPIVPPAAPPAYGAPQAAFGDPAGQQPPYGDPRLSPPAPPSGAPAAGGGVPPYGQAPYGQPPYGGQPSGGAPERGSSKGGNVILWIVLSIVGVVILIGGLIWWGLAAFVFASGEPDDVPGPVATATGEPEDESAEGTDGQPAPAEEPRAVELGELAVSGGPIVVDQGFGVGEVTVNSATVIDDYGGILAEEDDVFLLLDVTWATTDGDESSANRIYFSLEDATGAQMELDIFYLEDDRLVAERVAAGEELTKTLSFIVTDATAPFSLTVDSMTGAASEVITIG